jgi:chromosome segregation ATPase
MMKINLGKTMFGKEQQIEELSRQNLQLESQYRELQQSHAHLLEQHRQLERTARETQSQLFMLDLEHSQAKMNLISAESRVQKEQHQLREEEAKKEGNMGRIEGLQRENKFLSDKVVELQGQVDRLTSDLKVLWLFESYRPHGPTNCTNCPRNCRRQ